MGWTETASVGLTSAAGVVAAMAAAGLVAVGGNRTVSMTWTMPLLAAMLVLFMVIAPASDMANSKVEGLDGAGDDIRAREC